MTKTFYKSVGSGDERLGRENHVFDGHLRFFSNSPELVILNTYIFRYEPGKNNVTSATVYSPNPGVTLGAPEDVSYNLVYDAKGMITSNFLPYNVMVNGQTEINFRLMKYDCQ